MHHGGIIALLLSVHLVKRDSDGLGSLSLFPLHHLASHGARRRGESEGDGCLTWESRNWEGGLSIYINGQSKFFNLHFNLQKLKATFALK